MRDLINVEAIVNYIFERQNSDGGYTFCRGTESSAQDTFYAIKILNMLDVKPKNVKETVAFLHGLQHSDGSFDSVKVAYYVVESLISLGYNYTKPIDYFVETLNKFVESLGNTKVVYPDVPSEVEDIYFSVKVLNSFEVPVNSNRIVKQVLKLQNADGSFGRLGYNKLASTYYSLSLLSILGYTVNKLGKTLGWIRQCEVPSGGFVGEPGLSSIYMVMENIYFGVKALEVLNECCRYPMETLELIAKFQNTNGGFRRSIFLGISEFESTYQALSSIERIMKSSFIDEFRQKYVFAN